MIWLMQESSIDGEPKSKTKEEKAIDVPKDCGWKRRDMQNID